MSPRSCVTALPGPMVGGKRRLPVWARSLSSVQNPQLQALAQEWTQQQSMLSSMHLHPHQVLPHCSPNTGLLVMTQDHGGSMLDQRQAVFAWSE